MPDRRPRFEPVDLAQQAVGALVVAGGLLIPADIWVVAGGMSLAHAVVGTTLTLGLTYLALYTAVERRDPTVERSVAGLPLRFLSTVGVAVVVSLGVVGVYGLPLEGSQSATEAAKAVLVVTFFTALVAAAADAALE
ncbi:hypothetical protein [Halobaculum litoreum]|uniref:Integral membrane protein n=1 Tax=Halobaculum litoreum TaxID=3031998 RepID=A0ABD5XR75_9EURY|nr:hypothetical protein [Halobaculum sp. DT92]